MKKFVSIFLTAGLEILSTSYAGRPGKIALTGNFLGAVRNIRVKISNHFYAVRKTDTKLPYLRGIIEKISGDNYGKS